MRIILKYPQSSTGNPPVELTSLNNFEEGRLLALPDPQTRQAELIGWKLYRIKRVEWRGMQIPILHLSEEDSSPLADADIFRYMLLRMEQCGYPLRQIYA